MPQKKSTRKKNKSTKKFFNFDKFLLRYKKLARKATAKKVKKYKKYKKQRGG